MLMITFSPMSRRPSSVAEPRCGRTTTLLFFRSFRIDSRLVLEDIEARAADLSRLDHPGKGILVDDLAARRIHDIGRRLQKLQPPRRQKVEGRGVCGQFTDMMSICASI